MKPLIYLDYNATTPIADEVAVAMSRVLAEPYGNPSSMHGAGLPARDAVEKARSQVASLLCCDATEVVFTSGGTESNNHAIQGLLFFSKRDRSHPFHVITSCIEHPSVLEPCGFLVLSMTAIAMFVRTFLHYGEELAVLRGHDVPVFALVFAEEGRLLVSAGQDREIKIWDVKGRELRDSLTGHTAGIHGLAYRKGHSNILPSASEDGSVRL